MFVRIIHFLVFILPAIYCMGQDLYTHKADSLLKLLKKTESLEVTVQLYHQLASYATNQDISLNYEQQALTAALKTNDSQLIGDAYTQLGIHYRKHSEYASAIKYYNKALAASKNDQVLLNTYLELGIAHLRLTKFDSSEFYLIKGIALSTEQNNQPMTASFYNMMGNVFKEKNNYKEAVDYYLKATEIFEQLQDYDGLTQSLSNIGNLQNLMGNHDKAMAYAQKSLTIAEKINKQSSIAYSNRLLGRIYRKLQRYDEALLVYQKAIDVYETLGASRDVSETLTSMGNIYYEKNDLYKAKVHYIRSLSISKSLSDSSNMTFSYAALGYASAQLKQYPQAVLYFDSTIRIAKRIKLSALVMDSYLGLSELYADQKNFALAYRYHLRYAALNDSLTMLQNREEAANLEALYQNEKKENEIRALNAENELTRLRLQQQESQRNYLMGILALSLALIGLLYYLYIAKQKTNKKLEALNQVQSRFFANISHEFRTPLSLIIGPLQKIIQENPHAPESTTWKIMHRNAVRLLRLINQILDLSKIESGNMKLRAAEGDLKQFLKTVYASFISLAEQKQLDYTLQVPDGSVTGYFDRDKLEKIVSNLIYNALKFTPEGGCVQFSFTHVDHELKVQVKDNGPGIPADQLTQIFNRFHQVEGIPGKIVLGTGLGLALSKELTATHHGTLTAESPETGGSIFTLTIPTSHDTYRGELPDQVTETESFYDEHTVDEPPIEKTVSVERPVILIAEDHADMRTFIHQVVAEQFEVVMAENGTEAWDKALLHIPDLVISDLMMPGLNGTELCNRLKTHDATSHIPVIMLTARADQESKLEGLNTGADDYLTKPFDARELLVRIQNLVEQRKKLKALFTQQAASFTRAVGESRDTTFYNTVISIVEKNFADPAFGVEEFTREIGMSRMQLHRKLKALTDQSPGDFLRLFRLEHAKKLLALKEVSVSEVAYQSGFNNLPNFSRLFKAWAGVKPSEYQENSSKTPFVTNQQDIVTNP